MATRYAFTRPKLEAEECPERGRRVVWDTKTHGLCCRIGAEGSRVYWLSKWAHGGQRWERLGRVDELEVERARAMAGRRLVEYAEYQPAEPEEGKPRIPAPWEKAAHQEEPTLAMLHQDYLTHAKGRRRPKTLELYKSAWAHATPLHARKVGTISKADVQALVDEVGSRTPVMANRVQGLICTLYRTAIQFGRWRGHNPAIKGARIGGIVLHVEKSRDRILQESEIPSWWQSLGQEPPFWRAFFITALLTGARKANVCAARWAEFDVGPVAPVWTIPGEKAKSAKTLKIPISPRLVDMLKRWRKQCGSGVWIFPSPENPDEHIADPKKAWRRLVLRATVFRYIECLARVREWTAAREAEERESALNEIARLELEAQRKRKPLEVDALELVRRRYAKEVEATKHDPAELSLMDLHFHDLRRSAGSYAAVGHGAVVAGQLLGHRSLAATRVYTRAVDSEVRQAAVDGGRRILDAGGDGAEAALKLEDEGAAS